MNPGNIPGMAFSSDHAGNLTRILFTDWDLAKDFTGHFRPDLIISPSPEDQILMIRVNFLPFLSPAWPVTDPRGNLVPPAEIQDEVLAEGPSGARSPWPGT